MAEIPLDPIHYQEFEDGSDLQQQVYAAYPDAWQTDDDNQCRSRRGYLCTRAKGHNGPHIACGAYDRVLDCFAWWPNQYSTTARPPETMVNHRGVRHQVRAGWRHIDPTTHRVQFLSRCGLSDLFLDEQSPAITTYDNEVVCGRCPNSKNQKAVSYT